MRGEADMSVCIILGGYVPLILTDTEQAITTTSIAPWYDPSSDLPVTPDTPHRSRRPHGIRTTALPSISYRLNRAATSLISPN